MRKALPVLWRYLAVVAVSCLLTFFISQSKVEASTVMADVPAKQPTTEKDVAGAYEASGEFAVVTTDAVWRDSVRARDIPVRILSPMAASSPKAASSPIAASITSKLSTTYPVILFSHGLGGSREGGETWGKHWASHGYIVLHMQHEGSDKTIWKDKEQDRVRCEFRSDRRSL